MAATVTSQLNMETPDNFAYEVFTVLFDVAATATLTPTAIKAIKMVTITPLNAAATGAAAVNLSSFTVGNPTVTIAGPNTALVLVKLEGTIA